MKTVIRLVLLSVLVLFVLIQCSFENNTDNILNQELQTALPKFANSKAHEVIDLQLRWHHQFQFAGYYAALEKGFYKAEGLEVRLHAGDPQHQPVQEVLAGHAQYAEGNSEVLLARLQGQPLVALAAIFQHSPSVLLTRRDSGITSAQQLIGKKVMLMNKTSDADFLTMFMNEGINLAQLNIIASSYNLEDLITGKVDAFNSYTTNEPYFLKQRNIAYNIIDPATYRVNFYSDVLFTTEAELRHHPKRVEAMRRATLKGWRYAMDHPQEIIDLLLKKYQVEKTRGHLEFEAAEMRKLIFPDLIEIGFMNPGRWQHMADAFVQAGLTKPNDSLEGFIYDNTPKPLPKWVVAVLITAVVVIMIILAVVYYLALLNRRINKTKSILRESEANLRKAQEIAKIGSWKYEFADPIQWSDELYQIYGVSKETFIPTLESLISLIHPDDRQAMQEWIAACAAGEKPDELEFRCIWPDGSVHFINGRGEFVCNAAGKPVFMTGTAQNITERKKTEQALQESENRFRLMFERTADALMLFDPVSGQIANCNQATVSLFRGTDKKQILSLHPYELSPPYQPDGCSSLQKAEEMIGLALQNGSHRFEWIHRGINGQEFAAEVLLTAILDSNQQLIIATLRDITERKEAETALLTAKQAAETANKAKSEFLANMSHEIRTPMNAVIGLSHLVLKTKLDLTQRDYLQKISGAATALLGIINDILDFSKVEAGMLTIEQADFNLHEVMDHVANLNTLRAKEKGIALRFLLPPEVPVFLVGDALRIGQVLLNLVSNAIKFTEHGEVVVLVQGKQLNEATVELTFAVRDTGIGISKEELERLFQPFSQADSSTTRRFGGAGLGLVISKRLVELMNGSITVESRKGIGSVFRFSLPLGLQLFKKSQPTTPEQKPQELPKLDGIRVLLAEDNEINQLITVELLADVGVIVDVVENGSLAVERILANPVYYHAILMDVQMPVMDGIAATVKIREQGVTVPIIAMTAHAMDEEKRRCQEAGMNDHVAKPIDPEHLYDTLTRWV